MFFFQLRVCRISTLTSVITPTEAHPQNAHMKLMLLPQERQEFTPVPFHSEGAMFESDSVQPKRNIYNSVRFKSKAFQLVSEYSNFSRKYVSQNLCFVRLDF